MEIDEVIDRYNDERTHQGKHCQGRTPMESFPEWEKAFRRKELK